MLIVPCSTRMQHDLTLPVAVTAGRPKTIAAQEADESYNAYLLTQRQQHNRRTLIRIGFECYSRKHGNDNTFKRLRNKHLIVSLPSAAQAEAMIDAIRRVVAGFDGKFLAPLPTVSDPPAPPPLRGQNHPPTPAGEGVDRK